MYRWIHPVAEGGRGHHAGQPALRLGRIRAAAGRVVIILHFRADKAQEFERMFEAEVLPLWRDFKAQGKFFAAALSRVVEDHLREGIQDYMLEVHLPSMKEHLEFDEDPRFLPFLERAQAMQPEEADVRIGRPIFEV